MIGGHRGDVPLESFQHHLSEQFTMEFKWHKFSLEFDLTALCRFPNDRGLVCFCLDDISIMNVNNGYIEADPLTWT